MRRLVLDLDDIITCLSREDDNYSRISSQIEAYRQMGFEVVLTSSAGMIKYNGNVGKVSGHVAHELIRVIRDLDLEYDELVIGKPPRGPTGLVLDDKAVTPEEFLQAEYAEIRKLLDNA
jgi:capsule biosynthesis phosphatase